MEWGRMKKIISAFLTLLLCFQFFPPLIAVAVTMDGDGEVSLSNVEMEPTSTKNSAEIKITVNAKTMQAQEASIGISANFKLKAMDTKELTDTKGNIQGTYLVKENNVQLSINDNVEGMLSFYIEGGITEGTKMQKVLFNMGNSSKELLLPIDWMESKTIDSQSEISKEKEAGNQTSKKDNKDKKAQPKQTYRAAMNIDDIYNSLGLPDNFLTSMNLTFEDSNGVQVVDPTVNDTINFNFTFVLPEAVRQLMQGGDYYTIQLPDTVKIAQDQTYLLSSNGVQYATLTIDTSGLVTITFTNEVQDASDINGNFHFTGTFNKINIGGPGPIIIIPGTHEELQVTVNLKPNYTGDNIAKAGHFDRAQNPTEIIWNVDINVGLNSLTNAQVSETFPNGTTFESVQVYEVQVDFSGNVVAGSATLVDPSNYTVGNNGTVTFINPIQNAYQIQYTTSIDDDAKPAAGGQINFVNNAVLQSDGVNSATAQATVAANYGKEINKTRGNYDSKNQIINWKINYNYGEKSITNGMLTDTFQMSAMTLVSNSVKLYPVTFTNNGTAIEGTQLIEGTDYNLIPTGEGFQIEFLNTLQTAVDIYYQTGYNGVVDTTVTANNTVITESGETAGSTGSYVQQNVIKKLGAVNYDAKTVSWNIAVNINQYSMNNWQLTDTASVGLTLETNTFKIFDQNTQQYLVAGQDYTFSYDSVTRVISVAFINNYTETNHTFSVSYTDDYDTTVDPSPNLKFVNTAQVQWETTSGQTITDENSQTFDPNPATINSGSKSGSYNAITKLITWSVSINYRDEDIQNSKITDPILGNQNFVPSSMHIYHYTIASDGSIIQGAELTPTEYLALGIQLPTAGNNNTLIINFADNLPNMYLVVYQTSLNNELIHASYTNDAIYSNDSYPDYTLDAEVTINHGDELLTKSGVQDSQGYVEWSATINGGQSTLYETVIVDTPSANQSIDLSSVQLFNTTVDQAGNLTQGSQLVAGQDYSIILDTNNVTGQQVMTIDLINNYQTLTQALMLTYKTMVLLETSSGSVTNEIDLSSTGTTETSSGRSSSVDVVVGSGGGAAFGEIGSLTIQKTDPMGQKLPLGGTFELLDKNKNQVLRSGTVDVNGLLTFGALPYGSYILQETDTLTNLGYTISQQLVDGIPVEINAATTQGTPIVIQNQLGKIQMIKENEQGQALPGAIFQLEVFNPITSVWEITGTNQSLITDTDGNLTINGLSPGQYRLTEIQAPQGYIRNSESIIFNIVVNESNQLVAVGLPTSYTNYLAAISFNKTDNQGLPLQGAVFGLYNQEDLTTVLATATSAINGTVTFENVGPGNYEISEQSSPSGYLTNTEVLTNIAVPNVASSPVGIINLGTTFINYQGSVKLTKYGNSLSGRVPLSGVQFNLENTQEQVVASGTTDINGNLQIDNLTPGTYYFIEQNLGTNTQYILNTQPVEVVVAANASGEPTVVQVEMDNYQGAIQLEKVDSQGKPLSGAKFTLYNKVNDSVVQSGLTSDSNGIVSQANLAPGNYYLLETQAPVDAEGDAYIINDYPINFTIPSTIEGEPDTIDLQQFQNFQGKVGLTKVGQGSLPIAGAKFELYQAVGSNEVLVPVNGQNYIEADSNGTLAIDDLSPGSYKLIEIEAPTGYLINLQPIYFTVQAEDAGQPPVENFSIINYEVGIKARKVSDSNQPLPEYLANATFEILDSNNRPVQVYDNQNQPVYNFQSGINGEIQVTGLEAGSYTLVEIAAPDGYVKNTEGVPFTIEAVVGEPKPLILDLGNIVNYQGKIQIQKQDENNQLLTGGQFELQDENGQVIKVFNKAGLETEQLSAVDGEIFATGIPPGKYYLVETKAPAGYILEDNPKVLPVTINQAGAGEAGATFTGAFTNYQGSVLLNKFSVEAKKPLENAVFELYTKDEKVITSSLKTNKEGQIVVEKLAPGEYYFIEKEAPKGYELSLEKQVFTINKAATGKPEQIVLTMTNKLKPEVPVKPKKLDEKEGTIGKFGEQVRNVFVIVGAVLVIGVIGYTIWKKKK